MNGPEDFDTFSDVPYDIDFGSFTESINAIIYIGEYVLGIIGWFIVVALSILTVVDIVYLSWPPAQGFMRRKNWDGTQADRKFKIVSKDALKAVEMAGVYNGAVSNVWIYIKLRIKTFFICGIILSILVIGPGFVIRYVMKLVQPIFDNFHLIK